MDRPQRNNMKFILATKVGMTQVFDAEGRAHPVTVLSAGPVTVTQVKTSEKDGYSAVQVGYGSKSKRKVSKAVLGHSKGAAFAQIKEFKAPGGQFELGAILDASQFAPGDQVVVSGTSKGKGFQGVVKRHGFAGGPRSHGQKHSEREPGSIGGGLRNKVPKGMRMAGRMGNDRVSVKGLEIVQVDAETNTLLVSGAVPGRRGSVVEIVA
jgi:large subunit ribosomal protein L3